MDRCVAVLLSFPPNAGAPADNDQFSKAARTHAHNVDRALKDHAAVLVDAAEAVFQVRIPLSPGCHLPSSLD